jgi:GT2 family glycosyltransferase
MMSTGLREASGAKSAPPPLVSIVVVNWNGAAVLPRCLDALAAQTRRDFELLVVDNGSSDGSADGLEGKYPAVRLIRLERNMGYAAANNLAARSARGKWLALVNNDAFLDPNWLEAMVAAAEAQPEFTSFASRLLQADDPSRLDGAGDACHISGLVWRLGHGQPAASVALEEDEVFSPCGAAAFYLRQVFLAAGGFDEDYIAYAEDVDLGFRLRLLGHRCLYVPTAVAQHVGSSSYGPKSEFSTYYGQRNVVWTYVKNMPGRDFWIYLPAHLLANLAFMVYNPFVGHGRITWLAKWHALKGLPKAWRKRRDLQRSRSVPPSAISAMLDRAWFSPYVPSLRLRHQRTTPVAGRG